MSRAAASDGDQAPDALAPDRLAGFSHPRETTAFFGNADAERTLLDAVRGGRLHHAWLLSGPAGIGKATLAYRFARFVLAHPDASTAEAASDLHVGEDAPAFRLVAARAHPNLLVLSRPWQDKTKRFATAITVDEVRRLRTFLGRTAGEGAWRVVIVDAADDLNINAANALLKALEEPPARCLFLLVSAAPGRLPVTVRSRCRKLPLQALCEADLQAAVQAALAASGDEAPNKARLERAVRLADGSVRQALELLSGDALDLYGRLMTVLAGLPKLDYGAVHALADTLTARGQEGALGAFHRMLDDVLARAVRYAATGAGAEADEAALAERLIGARGLAQWAELWETLQRTRADAQALNLDRKNLILGTFFRLEDTARQTARPRS